MNARNTNRSDDPAVWAPKSARSCWIIVFSLFGLTATSGIIVFVGWLLMGPAAQSMAKPITQNQEPPAEIKPLPTTEITPIPAVEPPIAEDPDKDKPPHVEIKLHRRMPSPAAEQEPSTVAVKKAPALVIRDRESRPRLPLKWTVEKGDPRTQPDEMNLIMPIEVAKIDDKNLPYSVRRLQFPDGKAKQLRLAITPFIYDDMANLLTKMGDGYRFDGITKEDTYFFDKIKSYDVLFLTCAEVAPREFQAVASLRKYVEMGGTLYASDLRGDLLFAAFPEFGAKTIILPGMPQQIDASVTEKGLQTYLDRKTIPLNFDAPSWRPAAFDSSKVTVCLKGIYRNTQGQQFTVPLMVKFRVKRGTVIFTSFHNSKNDSEVVRKVLEYLVFSSVNARSEACVKELMQRSQFAPQDLRPVLISTNQSTRGTYQHKSGGLQIALGFENLGAKLKLTLHSPSGQIIEHEDQALYLIEVPKAESGAWTYTVSPVELPYANFPIILAIGMMKSASLPP